jgi:hypothetical protein
VHLATGPPLAWNEQKTKDEFWSFVCSLGGEWLWEHVFTPLGIDALVDTIAGGSAVLVTDGSYSRKIRSDIDGAGWMIYCRARKKVVFKCSFYEWCREAGSYFVPWGAFGAAGCAYSRDGCREILRSSSGPARVSGM